MSRGILSKKTTDYSTSSTSTTVLPPTAMSSWVRNDIISVVVWIYHSNRLKWILTYYT